MSIIPWTENIILHYGISLLWGYKFISKYCRSFQCSLFFKIIFLHPAFQGFTLYYQMVLL